MRTFSFLFACASGVLVATHGGCAERRSPGDAKEILKQEVGLWLPGKARNVYCHAEAVFAKQVYARFDLPTEDLAKLLGKDERLPNISDLKSNGRIPDGMITVGKRLPWWELGAQLNATSAFRTGQRQGFSADWIWDSEICVLALENKWCRVYLRVGRERIARTFDGRRRR